MMRGSLLVLMFFGAVHAMAAPKYVFLFIGDGMSLPQRMLAEDFSRSLGLGDLAMNHLPYQVVTRTRSANAVVTDSAASATAIACGEKTDNGLLGLRPDGSEMESVAFVAKRAGRKIGILTSVTINQATPAGFYAHRRSRKALYQIALDLVESGFDYFAGGGLGGTENDVHDPHYRGNIYDLAAASGLTVCSNKTQWAALRPGGRSWSFFGKWALPFEIDAPDANYPELHELVAKGIELMEAPGGFFMMCEGGRIDYAGHANDAATNLRDVIALDKAVRVALRFLDRHPNDSLVLVTGDHETGGLSMGGGAEGSGGHYCVELLAHQRTSIETFSEEMKQWIGERDGKVLFEDIKPVLSRKFGFAFENGSAGALALSPSETEDLRRSFDQDVENVRIGLKDTTAHDVSRRYVFARTVGGILNRHAGIGWGTCSHTALPVLTTAKGADADILVGTTENSDIGARLKALYAQE